MPSEQQHYVPRFLLKHFTKGKKPQTHVYDKSNDNTFKTHIKNIASENGFYDIKTDDGILTLEPSLAHLESNASGIIKRIIKDKTTNNLTEKEVAILSVFLAVQFVRTKEHRLRFEHMGELLADKMHSMGATEENIAEYTKPPNELPEGKVVGFKSILESNEFIPHFLNKRWVVFETNHKHPFYISDNPITLHNELDHGPYGNIGLAVKGIQIYMPISSTLTLGLLCPSIVEELQKGMDNIKLIDTYGQYATGGGASVPEATRAFCEGAINGKTIPLSEDNVIFMNSLQVTYSSRFVYCEEPKFELIKKMVLKIKGVGDN